MRTIVFDLDGTLADTSADLLAAANHYFLGNGKPAPLDSADALTAFAGGRAMLRLGFSRLDEPWDEARIEAAFPVFLQAYGAAIDRHTRLYPGTDAALRQLRDLGFALSICTNKPQDLAETLTQRLGIRHYFAALVGADTLPVRKPDPAPYVLAVTRAGGQVGRSFLVGDTITDLHTARAAGVPAVLVAFGPEGPAIARLQPDALLAHFDDLAPLALALLG